MTDKPTAFLSKLTFSSGQSYSFDKNDKIILVGPNNSGKSQSLREIMDICHSGKSDRTFVVKSLELSKSGSAEDLKQFLENNAEFNSHNSSYMYKDWLIHEGHIISWNVDYLQNGLLSGFFKNISAKDRLIICEQQNSVAPREQKTRPQHILYDDDSLMKKISKLFKLAFGKDLIFDFRGGSKIPIHVGNIPNELVNCDRVNDEYVNEVRKNPLLDKQGDGMKSYCGILFETIVNDLDTILVDEPEAFLHPPQMKKLGSTLVSEVNGQLVIATHSTDILRGCLEGANGNVRILRITRKNDLNFICEASNDLIKEIWSKPDLRYSNALEGIFHEQVIICEDDSDCRLINSISDYLEVNSESQWLDTVYVPTGGKHAIPKVAEVLRKIGVPVKAIFDIDFLSERTLVKKSVQAFGGEWSEVERLWENLDRDVRGGIQPKSNSAIKDEIINIITRSNSDYIPKKEIIEECKQSKSWEKVKKYGFRGIPNGQAQTNYNLLKEKLEDIGIYLVPVGEIENFCPDVGSHGPKFVTKVLSSIPMDDDRLDDLREFVDKVHFGQHGVLNNLSTVTS